MGRHTKIVTRQVILVETDVLDASTSRVPLHGAAQPLVLKPKASTLRLNPPQVRLQFGRLCDISRQRLRQYGQVAGREDEWTIGRQVERCITNHGLDLANIAVRGLEARVSKCNIIFATRALHPARVEHSSQ